MPDITVEFDSAPIVDLLGRLSAGLSPAGLAVPLKDIGEHVAETTRQRFVAGTAPDGSRWAPNAESTYLGMLGARDLRQDGRLNARGARRMANKRPLVDSGLLAEQIVWQLLPGGVEIGTNRFAGQWPGGAAVHQFGSRDGRIPARPFLGLSAEDESVIVDILERHLAGVSAAEKQEARSGLLGGLAGAGWQGYGRGGVRGE